MEQISDDTCTVLELVKKWERNPPVYKDSVFTDLGRVRYSLLIIKSLLSVVKALHKEHILHLDINSGNVFWGGQEMETGDGNIVFLADYGCAAKADVDSVDNKCVFKGRPSHWSGGFSAPELMRKHREGFVVSNKTDLYSVTALLLFLCLGDEVTDLPLDNLNWQMESYCSMLEYENIIMRKCAKLNVPNLIKKSLSNLIINGCYEIPEDREYDSAEELQAAIEKILNLIQEYKQPRIAYRDTRPISAGFVPRDSEMITHIETILLHHGICVLYGFSGMGKSETARQVADYMKLLSVEMYLPDYISERHYDFREEICALEYVNITSETKKEQLFEEYLENEFALLIVHNFNTVDRDFLLRVVNRKAKVIITSQCSPQIFMKEVNILQPFNFICLNEINTSFLRKVFVEQFTINKAYVLEHMNEVDKIIEGLYYNTLLVRITAEQLSIDNDPMEISSLADSICNYQGNLKNVFEDTTSLYYEKDSIINYSNQENTKNGIEEGNPFEIIVRIMHRVLPKFSDIQKQIFQILIPFPGEWIQISDISILLGDIEGNRKKKIGSAIRELQRNHCLDTIIDSDMEQVSLHPLMMQVLLYCFEGEVPLLELPSLDFFQHIERNIFVTNFVLDHEWKKKYLMTNNFGRHIFSYTQEWFLKHMKRWYLENKCIDELKRIDKFYDGHFWANLAFKECLKREYFNIPKYIDLDVRTEALYFFQVIIYYETGAVLLEECLDNPMGELDHKKNPTLRKFKVLIDANNQLNTRYYHNKKEFGRTIEDFSAKNHPSFCSAIVGYNPNSKVRHVVIPDTFCNIPIFNINFTDTRGVSIGVNDEYILELNNTCKHIAGNAYYAKEIFFDEQIVSIDFKHRVKQLNIPECVESISDDTLNHFVENIIISPQNRNFIKDKDGLIYTKEGKKLLFVPLKKRSIKIKTIPSVEYVNVNCFYYTREKNIYYMSIYELERLIEQKEFTIVEKMILEKHNGNQSIADIIKCAEEIVHIYIMESKKLKCPFYIKYFFSYYIWKDDFPYCNPYCLKEETIGRIIKHIPGDYLETIDAINFMRVYNLLIDEEISGIFPEYLKLSLKVYKDDSYFANLFKKICMIFSIEAKKVQRGINSLKIKYDCNSLYSLRILWNKKDFYQELIEELIEACGE